jgi:tRNA(Arg) A34 adenosine deaminase TadA
MARTHIIKHLKMAFSRALKEERDERTFWVGAVGVRTDGALVTARNGAVRGVSMSAGVPKSCRWHAEGRLVRKLDKGSTVYVARVLRQDFTFTLAKPCVLCERRLRSHGVRTVYYSVGHDHDSSSPLFQRLNLQG